MSSITIQDLLQDDWERYDFDDVEYVEIFELFEELSKYPHHIGGHNYMVLREMIVDKLREPGY